MEFLTTYEGIRGAIAIVKQLIESGSRVEAASLKVQLADLLSKLAETQVALVDSRRDIIDLESEVARLKGALQRKDLLERRRDALVSVDEDKRWIGGPYCLPCWESDHHQRSLTGFGGNRRILICAHCKHQIKGSVDLWGDSAEESSSD